LRDKSSIFTYIILLKIKRLSKGYQKYHVFRSYVIEKYELPYHKDDVQFNNKYTVSSCQCNFFFYPEDIQIAPDIISKYLEIIKQIEYYF